VVKDELTKQQMISHISNMIDTTKYCIHRLSSSYIFSPRNVSLPASSEVSASVSPIRFWSEACKVFRCTGIDAFVQSTIYFQKIEYQA